MQIEVMSDANAIRARAAGIIAEHYAMPEEMADPQAAATEYSRTVEKLPDRLR